MCVRNPQPYAATLWKTPVGQWSDSSHILLAQFNILVVSLLEIYMDLGHEHIKSSEVNFKHASMILNVLLDHPLVVSINIHQSSTGIAAAFTPKCLDPIPYCLVISSSWLPWNITISGVKNHHFWGDISLPFPGHPLSCHLQRPCCWHLSMVYTNRMNPARRVIRLLTSRFIYGILLIFLWNYHGLLIW